MQFASTKDTIIGLIAFVIVLVLFQIFDCLAKQYDKKHPNAPHISGYHMSPKANYSFTKGELIFHCIYFFVVIPVLIILFFTIRETIN